MNGTVPPLPLYAFMAGIGTTLCVPLLPSERILILVLRSPGVNEVLCSVFYHQHCV
jgi:hypothetical protein